MRPTPARHARTEAPRPEAPRRRLHGRAALAVVGAVTAAAVAVGPASAAPETAVFEEGGNAGLLSNGVSWTSDRALEDDGRFTLRTPYGNTVTFDETVAAVDFEVFNMIGTGNERECVTVPEGAEVVDLNEYDFDEATGTVCGSATRENSNSQRATFRVRDVSTIVFRSTGSVSYSRFVRLASVTVDRPPAVLEDDAVQATSETATVVDLLGNDTIPAGSSAPDVDATSAQGGTVELGADGTVTYTPPAGFVGTDSFTYRVVGPDGETRTATVTVTVVEDEGGVPLVAPGVLALAGVGGVVGHVLRRRRRG